MTASRRLVLALIALAIAAVAAWHFTGKTAVAPAAAPHGQTLPVDSVLLVRPAATKSGAAAPLVPPRAISPELAQFRARRHYAALYRALEASPPSAESLYLRAEIYSTCARPPGKSAEDLARERATRREQLVAGLAQGVAAAAQRIDAFDRLYVDPCEGLDLGTFDADTLARMVAAAADAGDVRARARQLTERIERSWQGKQVAGEQHGYALSEGDFNEARALLASNDPWVIHELQSLLSSTLTNGSIRLGNQPPEQAAFYTALTLLACDAAAPCGPDSPALLQNCAARGRCAAGSLYEYLYYYENSPADAQLIDSYRRTLQAMINGGDLSALAWSPLPSAPGYSVIFGGRRSGRPGG